MSVSKILQSWRSWPRRIFFWSRNLDGWRLRAENKTELDVVTLHRLHCFQSSETSWETNKLIQKKWPDIWIYLILEMDRNIKNWQHQRLLKKNPSVELLILSLFAPGVSMLLTSSSLCKLVLNRTALTKDMDGIAHIEYDPKRSSGITEHMVRLILKR